MCRRIVPIARDELERAIEQTRVETTETGRPGGCVALARQLREDGGAGSPQGRPDPDEHQAWPGSTLSVLLAREGRLALEDMTWGFPTPWERAPNENASDKAAAGDARRRGGRLIYNTRFESALAQMARGSGMWAEALACRRCVVPTRGFYEPHRTLRVPSPKTGRPICQQMLFDLADEGVTFLAGIYQDGRLSIVTTAPSEQVRPVHDRMPLVLTPREVSTWLGPRFAELAGREAARLDVRPQYPTARS